MLDLENLGEGHGMQYSRSSSMVYINIYKFISERFSLAPSQFSRYLHFEFSDLENVCQSQDVQHSQWRHSTADDSYLTAIVMFALSLTIYEIF